MLLVKRTESRIHRICQVLHLTVGVQLLPWPCAHAALAALKREEKAVEAGAEGGHGPAVDGRVCRVQIGELVRVGLRLSGFGLAKRRF